MIFKSKFLIITSLLLFLFIFIGASSAATEGKWQSEIVTTDLGGMTSLSNSIALDKSGNPHISYYDNNKQDLLYATKTGKNTWQRETVDSTGDVGYYCSLALDSNNNPHIAYRDDTNNFLKYAYKIGDNPWQTTIIEKAKCFEISLALNSQGKPFICYSDDTHNLIRYAFETGADSWSIETVDQVNSFSYSTSLALDSQGNPYISYCDESTNLVKYAYKLGDNSWQKFNIDTGRYPYLTLDNSGKPNIAYFNSSGLVYAVWNGSKWNKTTLDQTLGGYVYKLVIDSLGNPHIGYEDWFNGGNYILMKYANKTSAGWSIKEYASLEKGMGILSSMAIDNSRNPHFSYIYYGTLTYTYFDPSPIITATSPTNGSTKIPSTKTISIKFNEAIKKGSNFFVELKNSAGTAIKYSSSVSGNILYIDPNNNLAESLYTLVIHTGAVTDLAGNPVALKSFKFSVGTSPTVSSSNPVSGATKVLRNKTITVTFNESIKSGSNYGKITLKSSAGKTVTISKSISGKVLTIKHSSLLAANTKYTLTLYSGCVKDLAGNPVAAKTISFTTGSS